MEHPARPPLASPSHGRTLHTVPDNRSPMTFSTWGNVVATVLVALVPVSLAIHGNIKIVAPAALFLIGLYLLIARRRVWAGYRRAWPVMVCAGVVIAYTIASTLFHGQGASMLDGAAHILLYLVVAAAFAGCIDTRLMWAGFSLTAVGFGVMCIVQHFVLGIDRAYSLNGGISTSIELATLMLGLALMALVQLLRGRHGKFGICLHGAGLLLGVYGALLTQSRGPLLAFVPIFVGLLLLKVRQSGHWRCCVGGLIALVVLGTIATTTLHGAVLQRFMAIDQQVAVASTGRVDGSVSARLEMWRTAVRAFSEHPVAGLGADRFQAYMRKEVAAGRTDAVVERYNNPHNMYLGAAAAGGVPGLLVLLAMFFVPLGFFARHVMDRDDATATAAWSGLAIIVLYMLCALTDSIFYRVMTQSFYFFLVLGLSMWVAHRVGTDEASTVG